MWMVEESRLGGHIIGAINSTYIALIPKQGDLRTFSDYRPISLCNLVYKLISKIIALEINNTLSTYISPEKYRFLQDIQIHDAVETTQECMHSIHTKKMEAIVMKVDLQKAYDSVDWTYLHIVLHRIGLQMHNIEWIMACVTTIRYAVIINGYPTSYFGVGKGL